MTFIDLFAGIGGFRRGMELAGHRCVGFCEWDKFATASYTSMHLITDEQRQKLASMSLKERQKEILKDEYRNGEWYSPDIRQVGAGNVPRADCWCFGAPCQDFSIAGKRAGLDGDRSSLVREVFRVLGELEEEDRPEWLIYENVKGMLSSNRGGDFLSIILAMEELGYDIEWQVFNSKYHGVPQNRERVYTLGHLRARGRKQVFPLRGAAEEDSADIKILGHYDGYRRNRQTFSYNGITEALSTCEGGGREHHTAIPMCIGGIDKGNKKFGKQYAQQDRVYDGSQVATSLTSQLSGNVNNYAIPIFGIDYNSNGKERQTANELTTRNNENGVGNVNQDGTAVCIPVLTPDRAEKRQNGRRFKDDGEEAFTLTSQDKHGVAIGTRYTEDGFHCYRNDKKKSSIQGTHVTYPEGKSHCISSAHVPMTMCPVKIREATVKGYAEAEIGDSVNLSMPDSKTRRGRVKKKQANTLDTSCEQGVVVPVIWYEKYGCYIAIRKLTPKECFRLQSFSDEDFAKAQFVNSDSQLYKQAGNSVTVNVVYDIAKAIGGKT